jgi:hypothetical protein
MAANSLGLTPFPLLDYNPRKCQPPKSGGIRAS